MTRPRKPLGERIEPYLFTENSPDADALTLFWGRYMPLALLGVVVVLVFIAFFVGGLDALITALPLLGGVTAIVAARVAYVLLVRRSDRRRDQRLAVELFRTSGGDSAASVPSLLRVMPDCGSSGIWEETPGESQVMITYDVLKLPAELADRFQLWQQAFDSGEYNDSEFEEEGLALAAELKHVVGSSVVVEYGPPGEAEQIQ